MGLAIHGADSATQSVQNSDLQLLARRFRKLLVGRIHSELGQPFNRSHRMISITISSNLTVNSQILK